jgi:hypothetical protein
MSATSSGEVPANSLIVLITRFGRYNCLIGEKTTRANIVIAAQERGAFGYEFPNGNILTHIQPHAILGIEFPKQETL